MEEHVLARLQIAMEHNREELMFRRRRENQAFVWSSTLFAGFSASVLYSSGPYSFVEQAGLGTCVVVTLVLGGIALFSIAWQQKQRESIAAHQMVLAKLGDRLGFFGEDLGAADSLYEAEWRGWGTRHTSLAARTRFSWRQIFSRYSATKVNATAISAAIAAAIVWLRVLG
ncbi:MAG: hypothetical protein AB7U23_14765 [Dehalococcoidia bacterium]